MEPRPRTKPIPHEPLIWPVTRTIAMSMTSIPEIDFVDVLNRRRSQRRLRPAPLRAIAGAIAFATRSRFVRTVGAGAPRYRRPAPSAGALHPLSVLIVPARGRPRALLCNPDADLLVDLELIKPKEISALHALRYGMVPEANGDLVILVGDKRLVEAHYDDGATLFWRDAGALAQTLLLTFEACDLGACLLGVSGAQAIDALGLARSAKAAGVIVVGAPSE